MTKPAKISSTGSLSAASCPPPPAWQAAFLEMLPKIEEHARFRYRHLKGDHRDEAVQEVIANACQAYERLIERGCAENATWSSLAKYAVRQVQAGRKVGGSLNIRDVTSCHCQLRTGLKVQSLTRWDDQNQEWQEMVVEDRHQTPAEVAAFRLDFREFLTTLSRRNRKIALRLAQGHSTGWVANAFRLSKGRVSQIRRELADAWRKFQSEPVGDQPALQDG